MTPTAEIVDCQVLVRFNPKKVLRRHGRSFYLASFLLPSVERLHAAQLYTLCRTLDDLVDDSVCTVQARTQLTQIAKGILQPHQACGLSSDWMELMSITGIKPETVLDLIDGLSSDLDQVRITDERALLRYAYRVAGTVGLMMCAVLDVQHPAARPFAIDLGVAMQLTNIARDVLEDAERGRRYLPESWVGDLSPERVLKATITDQAAMVDGVRRCLKLAQRYYHSGIAGLHFLPRRFRPAILVAARIYQSIGDCIRSAGYRTGERRAVVPARDRILIAAGALIGQGVAQQMRSSSPAHDAGLHRHLGGFYGANSKT
ncbi:MAG: phytoene/squalene synthase family protein [Wenzhouxiangella sp.]|nr:phytoene/squalene synthase family protein [Wenzhouxiangella sp.]